MNIKPEDLEISTFNTGSAWVPNYNGVRILHIPTRLVAECGEHRSQHRNRAQAMDDLAAKVESWKPTKESFDNSTIRERTPGKPHIVFVAGYWRVSTWKRGTGDLYYKAHAFIRRLNGQSLV